MLKTVWWTGVLLGAGCLLVTSRASSPGAQPGAEERFIAEGVRHFRELAEPMQARLDFDELQPREMIAAHSREPVSIPEVAPSRFKDRETKYVARWYSQGSSLAMVIAWENAARQPGDAAEAGPTPGSRLVRLAIHEGKMRVYEEYPSVEQPSGRPGPMIRTGTILDADLESRNGMWRRFEWLDPRYYAYTYEGSPLDEIILASNPKAVKKGEEVISGDSCIKIETWQSPDHQTIFWLDREHDLVVRQIEGYIRKRGRMLLVYQATAPRLARGGGAWLPAVFESRFTMIGEMGTPGSVPAGAPPPPSAPPPPTATKSRVKCADGICTFPPLVRKIIITDFAAGIPVPPEMFMLDYPPDTRVRNELTNETVRVRWESLTHNQHEGTPPGSGVVR